MQDHYPARHGHNVIQNLCTDSLMRYRMLKEFEIASSQPTKRLDSWRPCDKQTLMAYATVGQSAPLYESNLHVGSQRIDRVTISSHCTDCCALPQAAPSQGVPSSTYSNRSSPHRKCNSCRLGSVNHRISFRENSASITAKKDRHHQGDMSTWLAKDCKHLICCLPPCHRP